MDPWQRGTCGAWAQLHAGLSGLRDDTAQPNSSQPAEEVSNNGKVCESRLLACSTHRYVIHADFAWRSSAREWRGA